MKPRNLMLLILIIFAAVYAMADWHQRGAYEPLGHWAQGFVNQWRVK